MKPTTQNMNTEVTKLITLFPKHRIQPTGSVYYGTEHEKSDIDILVYPPLTEADLLLLGSPEVCQIEKYSDRSFNAYRTLNNVNILSCVSQTTFDTKVLSANVCKMIANSKPLSKQAAVKIHELISDLDFPF